MLPSITGATLNIAIAVIGVDARCGHLSGRRRSGFVWRF
ncbi:hypothetical protein BN903_65 [Halorubrum sp. AJ67]|nr:hypothetical protein BN903_65 [Halorubrum sp. AJ67]